jgi:hypothetical protein
MKEFLTTYRPIIIIAAISLIIALATSMLHNDSAHIMMNNFMGSFLCILAMLKLFDINGFIESFSKYDIIAARCRQYAKYYPYIELIIGFMLLSGMLAVITNIFLLIVMTAGLVGILNSLKGKKDLKCACVGNLLNIPLGSISITENATMIIMASMNLVILL